MPSLCGTVKNDQQMGTPHDLLKCPSGAETESAGHETCFDMLEKVRGVY